MTLTHKWMIHPTPGLLFSWSLSPVTSCIPLILFTPMVTLWIRSSFQSTSKIWHLLACLFSHLLIVSLGDLQTLPPLSSLDFMTCYFCYTFVLPTMTFCYLYSPAVHFLYTCCTQANVTQYCHHKLMINNHFWALDRAQKLSCIYLFKLFYHLINPPSSWAKQTIELSVILPSP